MIRGRLIGVLVAGAPLLGGCDFITSSGGGLMRPAPLVDYSVNVPFADASTGQIIYNPPSTAATPVAFAAEGLAVSAPSSFSPSAIPVLSWDEIRYGMESPTQRDFVQDALLQRSDVLCERYLDSVYFRVTLRRTLLGGVSQVASAIGSFSNAGAQAASVASLIANIAGDTNNLLDAEILQNQMVTLISKQIRSNRDQILGQIMKSRVGADDLSRPMARYPLSLALRDAMNYHQQCSFLAGVTGLSVAADKPNPASNAQSQAVKTSAANAEAAAISAAAGTSAAVRVTPTAGR